MKIHLFQDYNEVYINYFYNNLIRINYNKNSNQIINIINKNVTKDNKDILYFNDFISAFNYLIEIKNLDHIIFHVYNEYSRKILLRIKKLKPEVKFSWMFWSGEFYKLSIFKDYIYLGESKRYINTFSYSNNRKYFFKEFIKKIIKLESYRERRLIESYKHIDYIYSSPGDYKNIMRHSNSKMIRCDFLYTDYKDTYTINNNVSEKYGYNIMINHCYDPSMNHFDAIDRIKEFASAGTFILPMAYGENLEYSKAVTEYTKELFGDKRVLVWEQYVSIDEYIKKISTIDVAIFNSTIQQGFGNILQLLYVGVKLFLRNENSLYDDLTRNGFVIKSIQNELNYYELYKPLTLLEKNQNRKLIEFYYSKEKLDMYILEMFNR
jgi:dTDP-N-acetylfucosamine:lipid II N-acetylfucosaminyltransferase